MAAMSPRRRGFNYPLWEHAAWEYTAPVGISVFSPNPPSALCSHPLSLSEWLLCKPRPPEFSPNTHTLKLIERRRYKSIPDITLWKDDRSLVVNLQQHYFLPFDNVSKIHNETSDTLCRAITGGAVQQRKLHTNGEDYIFTFKRCLTLNGINNVANQADQNAEAINANIVAFLIVELMRDRPDWQGRISDLLTEL